MPKPAMERAVELGMPALAITDHGVLYGVVEFYKQALQHGIKPILGCEVYVAPGSRFDRKANGSAGHHLVLLAEDLRGYYNLVRLVSLAHLEGFYYKPRIDKELLAQYQAGLICLSSCLKGEIAEAAAEGDLEAAEKAAREYAEIFGKDRFYIELQDHGLPRQRTANVALVALARRLGLPLVATNDVHYLRPEHAEAHDVLLCLQTQTVLSDPNRMRYESDQFYMKSGEEMAELFREVPEAVAATLKIAERCTVELPLEKELHFPKFQVPDGRPEKEFLEQLALEGIRQRYGIPDPAHPRDEREQVVYKRLRYELDIIAKTGFVNYFLVVWDFVRFAREQGIPVGPGRGSGAGSIVAYALGITGIDPLRYNLIFERFLNPERVSPPDFDIDFCQVRRDEVIEYVRRKYGRENVAQIITFGTLGAKLVIRDVGRVLEVPLSECDRLAKMVPEDPAMTLELALKLNPEFRREKETNPIAQRILKYAEVLEGLPRNPGTHAAGVVIGERPLIELVPLQRGKDGEVITQFDMDALGEMGLLKMDFLGLKTLTVIHETVQLIREVRGENVDIQNLPMDDPATFDLLNRGDTVGVFQVESKGMRDLLRRIGLTCFEDLIAMIALFRPGPMNMLDDYIARKHGKVKITYDHPLLEPILRETYGVMLYQEQVQQVANVLAGFTLGQGDILRRAMGKKKQEVMDEMEDKFVQGCQKTNNIPAPVARKIFADIARFAGYGFNKSHSAAYAILSYQTAWLKAHYPVEFMAALLSSEIGNTDKLPVLIAEAREMGIEVLPPNVNESDVRFRPEGRAIRFGLAGVKNVGVSAVEAIVAARREGGPFKGLVDFCCRVDLQRVNRKVIESLIKCGAFDFTGYSRGRLFAAMDFALDRAAHVQQDHRVGQTSLFSLMGDASEAQVSEELPPADPWPENEMLAAERELLGFYISGHPLTVYEWTLKTFGAARVSDLDRIASGSLARVGGLVTQLQKKYTRKDERPMAVFRLELLEGNIEVVVFPDTYQQYGVLLQEAAPVMVCGVLEKDEQFKLRAQEIYLLKDVPRYFSERLSIHLPVAQEDKLWKIKEILARHPGSTPVTICLEFPLGEKVFVNAARSLRAEVCETLIRELQHVVGEEGVYLAVLQQACRNSRNHGNARNRGAPNAR